jgi:tRNA modification GTPase
MKTDNSAHPGFRQASDTIFALSSGGLPAGLAVIRISGPEAFSVSSELCGTLPPPRRAALRTVRAVDGSPIDTGLVLVFPKGQSFTGEDTVELQLHGGRAVVAAVQALLGSMGLRQADAGEFSRRAFDNGRLDLVEVEGLADLLAAETEMQRRLAIDHSSGRQSMLYQDWLATLTRIRALTEAELDFPDEDDVPGALSDTLWPELEVLHGAMRKHVTDGGAAEIIRDGFRVAIAGRPNAGKSSLLNALAKRDVAIVTAIAGTTRDVIGLDVDLGGYLVHLMDTAGLRETDDPVEREGVHRALVATDSSDLVLYLKAADDFEEALAVPAGRPVVTVLSKCDLIGSGSSVSSMDTLQISVRTGEGIDSLTKRITEIIASRVSAGSTGPARRRQRELIAQALGELETVLDARQAPLEVRAEGLRRASHALEKMLGRIDADDLLGLVFSEFCIGK